MNGPLTSAAGEWIILTKEELRIAKKNDIIWNETWFYLDRGKKQHHMLVKWHKLYFSKLWLVFYGR